MTKAKKKPTEIKHDKFMSIWVHRFIRAWYVAVLIALGLTHHLFFFVVMEVPTRNINDYLGMVVLPAFITGWVVGLVQKRHIRRYSHWHLDTWVLMSILGSVLGWLFVVFIAPTLEAITPTLRQQFLLGVPIYIGVMSTSQWVVLRRDTHDAWMWIVANIVGAIAFVMIAEFGVVTSPIQEMRYDRVMWGSMNGLLLCCIGPIVYALILGGVLMYKIQQHSEDDRVATTPKQKHGESSVWDEAI
jgi:uncharacterized membrane protein